MSITIRPTTGSHHINLANGNAAELLNLLGLTFDGNGGETTAADMLGRILIAQALLDVATDDDTGRPEYVQRNLIHWQRRPGYLADKLAELHELATWAHERHASIVWS